MSFLLLTLHLVFEIGSLSVLGLQLIVLPRLADQQALCSCLSLPSSAEVIGVCGCPAIM